MNTMKPVTIKDLAKRLKLSSSTVSRALCSHSDINSKTKERVLEAAKKYNYRPNQAAKSLQNKSSYQIGVIVPEIRNPFFSTVISGIEEITYEAGYSILVCQSVESYARELINIKTLVANNVAGILVCPSLETVDPAHINEIQKKGLPIVLFDRTINGLEASSVIVDDFAGAYQAVSYLIQNGYKKIAHLTGSDTMYVSKKRKEGYLAALRDSDLEAHPEHIIVCGIYEEDGVQGTEKLLALPNKPDAIFAFNDPVALGVLQSLRDNNIKIPEEIGIIGFTNNSEAAIVTPRLTTINQPAVEIGQTAAKLLLKSLTKGQDKQLCETIVLETELVVRESC